MYPLDSIKAEGLGSQLAEAVDGLRNGSSPMMYMYKNAVSWGKVVQDYLRSEKFAELDGVRQSQGSEITSH
jgi:hypothetical protein